MPFCVAILADINVHAASPTISNISIDGNMSDWNLILANPKNHALDAAGNTAADLDTPVPRDRDLLDFAFTWDNSNLYFYVRRRRARGATRMVVVYVDIDNNGLMENTDKVIVGRWFSGFGLFLAEAWDYNSISLSGDPITDGLGQEDGYTLPGDTVNSGSVYFGFGSSPTARELEWGIPWAELGVPAGAAVSMHVSMANKKGVPDGVRDNMTGQTTGYAAMQLSSGATVTATTGETVVLAHNVTNTGNLNNSVTEFALAWGCPGAPLVTFYQDINANGTLETSVDVALLDTNGDSRPDLRINSGQSVGILATVKLPAGLVAGTSCTASITAEPENDPTCGATAVNIINVAGPIVSLIKGADQAMVSPGQTITYTTDYQNTGIDTAFVVVIMDAIPSNTTYVQGSTVGIGTTMEYSHDNGSSFDASEIFPVTHVRWVLVNPLPVGGAGQVRLQVKVD